MQTLIDAASPIMATLSLSGELISSTAPFHVRNESFSPLSSAFTFRTTAFFFKVFLDVDVGWKSLGIPTSRIYACAASARVIVISTGVGEIFFFGEITVFPAKYTHRGKPEPSPQLRRLVLDATMGAP